MSTFITVTDRKNGERVTLNLRHVNVIRASERGEGTYLGINNYGALGFNVTESYPTILDMLARKGTNA